ncbi:SFT2 domain containing 2b isoform X2 [Echeneis naucrates]|uniref:SFT2 domain containing 2b isoform X2 n=1 Tax=Echeneis naucrates TaxID=173247 RepID=UPI0011138254|nr:vesicle transport protein SFT2B isoform X2 [Echeneis naucrates]
MDKLKKVLSGQDDGDRDMLEGTCMLWIPGFGLTVFAVFYSVGNICALASTMFLVGPCQQLKTMWAKERALATVIMMLCLTLTLCAAFWWKNNGLALLFCVLQFLAFTWYATQEQTHKVFTCLSSLLLLFSQRRRHQIMLPVCLDSTHLHQSGCRSLCGLYQVSQEHDKCLVSMETTCWLPVGSSWTVTWTQCL